MSKRLTRLVIVLTLPVVVLTTIFYPNPQRAAAGNSVACANPVIAFGRQRWCGYFSNRGYDNGTPVRNGGMPGSVNHADEFINMVEGDLHSGDAHRITAAQFLILTMIGRGPGNPKSVTEGPGSQLEDWKERVRSYADTSENGVTSVGQNGRIDWNVWTQIPCTVNKTWGSNRGWYGLNTYYQRDSSGGYNDVAPYLVDCGSGTSEEFVLFRDSSGKVIYRIRRACLNPIGEIGGLKKPQPNRYDLEPSITARVDGAVVTGGAEIGQTIQFSYAVRNSGTDPSPATTSCTIYTNTHGGYFAARSNPPAGGGAGPGTGCPRSFAANSNTPLGGVESVSVGAGNQTICRTLVVSPATAAVASRSVEACVPIVNKPYFKVYGGDLSAGSGFETAPDTCTLNSDAAVIGWNRGASGTYGGAGVQYAAYALNQIYEVASAVGNSGPSRASVPGGLTFAVNASGGNLYGGSFGSLPCIRDFYGKMPANPRSFSSLNAANISGAYKWDTPGQLNLSGRLNGGKRVTVYVRGDVLISGDITYPNTWNAGSLPLFQLVVKGNIYIRNNVSRIDGIFIAQKDGASGGTIYTCTTGGGALVPDVNLYNRCNSKLTINGAFIANAVQFLRANGTKHRGSGNEASGSGNISEVFNFSPAFWMAQPADPVSGSAKYDSITGLPPVL